MCNYIFKHNPSLTNCFNTRVNGRLELLLFDCLTLFLPLCRISTRIGDTIDDDREAPLSLTRTTIVTKKRIRFLHIIRVCTSTVRATDRRLVFSCDHHHHRARDVQRSFYANIYADFFFAFHVNDVAVGNMDVAVDDDNVCSFLPY